MATKARLTLVTMVALSALFCLAKNALGAEQAPQIKGKPLSRWISQLRGSNRGLQVRAARALREAPEAVRAGIIPQIVPVLKSTRENDRFVAAQIVGQYGVPAKAAVPGLLEMLKGTQYERNRSAAAKALGRILKDAPDSEEIENVTQRLIPLFKDAYPDVRREAVKACGMIGKAAKVCLPYLVKPLGYSVGTASGDAPLLLIRRSTAWTLSRMGPLAADYIDRLVAQLKVEGNENPEILEAIGEIGTRHENVIFNIVDFIEKGKRDWRHHAKSKLNAWRALEKFGPQSAPVIPLLSRYLKAGIGEHEPPEALLCRLKVIQSIGPGAKNALSGLKVLSQQKRLPRGWSRENLNEVLRETQMSMKMLEGKSAEQNDPRRALSKKNENASE